MEINPVAASGFTAGAEVYDRGRPSYAPEVLSFLVEELGVGAGRRVLDLAAGTGKLTALLAGTAADVVAVEPLDAMRAVLEARLPGVEAMPGTAEAIPLGDASVDVVTVAQAFHWFRPAEALAEIARVLRPGGTLVMVWNERDESVPWVAQVGAVIDWETRRPYDVDTDWSDVVARSGRFSELRVRTVPHAQVLDADTLVERMLSTSYVAAQPPEQQAVLAERIRQVVAGFPATFPLPYRCQLYWATRR